MASPLPPLRKAAWVVEAALRGHQKDWTQQGPLELQKQEKIHTAPNFGQPQMLRLHRRPKHPRRGTPRRNELDLCTFIRVPLTTKGAMEKIEDNDTPVCIVEVKANKQQIKRAGKKLHDIDAAKGNALTRPRGGKEVCV
ncbi:large ribosomal subunit protein uL23-like [Glossophaga mutica]